MSTFTHILAFVTGMGIGSILGFLAFRYAQEQVEEEQSDGTRRKG